MIQLTKEHKLALLRVCLTKECVYSDINFIPRPSICTGSFKDFLDNQIEAMKALKANDPSAFYMPAKEVEHRVKLNRAQLKQVKVALKRGVLDPIDFDWLPSYPDSKLMTGEECLNLLEDLRADYGV